VRFPSVRDVYGSAAASPLAVPLAALTAARGSMIDDDRLLFPTVSHIFLAVA
jgi:hypothetical protein